MCTPCIYLFLTAVTMTQFFFQNNNPLPPPKMRIFQQLDILFKVIIKSVKKKKSDISPRSFSQTYYSC